MTKRDDRDLVLGHGQGHQSAMTTAGGSVIAVDPQVPVQVRQVAKNETVGGADTGPKVSQDHQGIATAVDKTFKNNLHTHHEF